MDDKKKAPSPTDIIQAGGDAPFGNRVLEEDKKPDPDRGGDENCISREVGTIKNKGE